MTVKIYRFKAEIMTSAENQALLPNIKSGKKDKERVRQKNEGKTGKEILLPHLQKGGKL